MQIGRLPHNVLTTELRPWQDDGVASHIGHAHVAFDYFHGLRFCDMPISWLDHKPHYRAARHGLTRTGLSPAGLRQLLFAPSEIGAKIVRLKLIATRTKQPAASKSRPVGLQHRRRRAVILGKYEDADTPGACRKNAGLRRNRLAGALGARARHIRSRRPRCPLPSPNSSCSTPSASSMRAVMGSADIAAAAARLPWPGGGDTGHGAVEGFGLSGTAHQPTPPQQYCTGSLSPWS